MRLLLPPSEGKTVPQTGPPLSLESLSFPSLHDVRAEVLHALTALCGSDAERAREALGLGSSLLAEVHRNADLMHQPCAPAGAVYSGVLFSALDLASLPPSLADASVLIASALFGVLRPCDLIPAYRLSGSVRLPGLATPRRTWGAALSDVIEPMTEQDLMVDLRSQPYANLCPGRGSRWVQVRVMTVRNGRRVPVSHHNKATKGALARSLLQSRADPQDAAELLDLVCAAGWEANLEPGRGLEVLTKSPVGA